MHSKLKIFVISFLIILVAVFSWFANKYLSENKFLMYATGTNDKAFLNATWKMSPQEIERANKTFLSKEKNNVFAYLFLPNVTNKDRFKLLSPLDVSLWGHEAKVVYTFFDNMLCSYYIIFTTDNKENTNKEILKTLHGQFGVEKKSIEKEKDVDLKKDHFSDKNITWMPTILTIYKFDWDTEKQSISYWMDEWEIGNTVYITANYKPLYKQIEKIAENEKKSYF